MRTIIAIATALFALAVVTVTAPSFAMNNCESYYKQAEKKCDTQQASDFKRYGYSTAAKWAQRCIDRELAKRTCCNMEYKRDVSNDNQKVRTYSVESEYNVKLDVMVCTGLSSKENLQTSREKCDDCTAECQGDFTPDVCLAMCSKKLKVHSCDIF